MSVYEQLAGRVLKLDEKKKKLFIKSVSWFTAWWFSLTGTMGTNKYLCSGGQALTGSGQSCLCELGFALSWLSTRIRILDFGRAKCGELFRQKLMIKH